MPRAGLTTAKVAQAGAELADEVGLEQVTVSEVARRFDVKVASLYSHVRGTEDLRRHIALVALQEMAERGDEALAGRSGRNALVALGNVYRTYAWEHPGRYDAARLRLDADTAATSAGPRHARMLRATLRGYDLKGDDEMHAVRLLGSLFHGYVSLERAGGFEHSDPDPQESWSTILDRLDAMLRTWATP